MIKFLDGPAVGVVLGLKRTPKYLRVVKNRFAQPGKEWDALDQLHDTPKPHETIFAYQLVSQVRWVHLCCSGRGAKNASGFFPVAEYRLSEVQPAAGVMHSNENWAAWATAEHTKESR